MTATNSELLKSEMNLAKAISIGEKEFPKTMINVVIND